MNILAADLGATSGRLMLGRVRDQRIELEELARFPNRMVDKDGFKVWDFQAFLDHILRAVAAFDGEIASLGVDSWGVDYGYLDAEGNLLGDVMAYRDPRTEDEMARVLADYPDLYKRSGIQVMFFNTMFQVIDDVTTRPEIVEKADRILLIPDLINYMLTGEASNEYTICSTTALLDMRSGAWDTELMEKYGVRTDIWGKPEMPGRLIGTVHHDIARRTGKDFPVCLVAGHDTASAIAGIPVLPGKRWGYISSGTWSLVGVETDKPITNDAAIKYEITNEGGVEGTIRFLKNVCGMWLLEQSLEEWKTQGVNLTYENIVAAATDAEPFRSLINPDEARFAAPESMLEAIRSFCRETSQPIPESIGQVARCIFESLAMRYRGVFAEIAEATGEEVEEIHIVGGGSRNAFLNQMTADATGRKVIQGPSEATVMGNIALQAVALGAFETIADYRQKQVETTTPTTYEPQGCADWQTQIPRFQGLCGAR